MGWLNSWLIQFKPGKATTPPEVQTCCQAAYENRPYSVKVVATGKVRRIPNLYACVYAYWSLCT